MTHKRLRKPLNLGWIIALDGWVAWAAEKEDRA